MLLKLDRRLELPLYRQLSDQLRSYIRQGVLAPGSQLPTVRELAKSVGLTRLTVQTAYAELQAEGLIESFVGRGTFVADKILQSLNPFPVLARTKSEPPPVWYSQNLFADMVRLARKPGLISFTQAAPNVQTLPSKELNRALQQAAGEMLAFTYGALQGEQTLREEIAHLLLDRGIVTTADNIMVTSGAQQALDLVLRTFLKPEDVLVVEEPTYPGLVELTAQRRQRVVSVPVDENGMQVEQLAEICTLYRPRLLYTMPTFHNPTGLSLSPERRATLLQLAQTYDFTIVEDDVYGFLGYNQNGQPPQPALKTLDATGLNRVIYLTSFSKILAPGLRIGAVVAGPHQLSALLTVRRANDLGSPALQQAGLATYLRRRHLPLHLQRVRTLYYERLQIVLKYLQKYFTGCQWHVPEGGLCVWVKLPDGINEREFYLEAIERGVGVTPGQAFLIHPLASGEAFIRLGFSSPANETELEKGLTILGDLLADYRKMRSLRASNEQVALLV